jgi:hypothetical protein
MDGPKLDDLPRTSTANGGRFSGFRRGRLWQMMVHVVNVDDVWARIQTCAEQEFRTVTGIPFTYEVPGNNLRVHGIHRNLSRTNFAKAIELMPAGGPGQLKARQGASYTWAVLMDPRIRQGDW